jgi:hypothetical protein
VQYYARDGVCQLELTQSLNRALQTFAAILAADAELEGRGKSTWPSLMEDDRQGTMQQLNRVLQGRVI